MLDDWRQKTNDVIPSEFAGTRISERFTETYLTIHGPSVTSRSAIACGSAASKTEHRLGARMAASAYLVLASQRSGSTLLVESLGPPAWPVNPVSSSSTCRQPASRRNPGNGSKESTTSRSCNLLDPLDEGKPDLAPPEIWRDYIRTVGRTPNGIWGGKLMWNQTPLLLARAEGLPDRSGDGLLAAIRDVIGSDPVLIHVYRPDVVSQAVSFWRAVQTRVWRGRPDPEAGFRAPNTTQGPSHMSSPCCASRRKAGARGSTRRASRPWSLLSGAVAQPHPDRRHRTRSVGTGSAAGACAGIGTPGGSTVRRMGRPLPSRGGTGGPARHDGNTDQLRHPARRRVAAARSRSRAHHPRGGCRTGTARCCCSLRARTPSCCYGWRRRLFGHRRCHSR